MIKNVITLFIKPDTEYSKLLPKKFPIPKYDETSHRLFIATDGDSSTRRKFILLKNKRAVLAHGLGNNPAKQIDVIGKKLPWWLVFLQ